MTRLATGIPVALLLSCIACNSAAQDHHLRINGVDLMVEMDADLEAGEDGYPWTDWLTTTLQAASTVTGSFPREGVRIQLQSTSRSSGAIAFGQVRRSHPPRLRFYVAADASLAGLNADWRGYHEFAHLLIPFPGNDDIWFTEGFASYYQHLLQSRAGVITERQAWQELLDGFERGERDRSGRGRTLRSLSPDMWRERAHKRVYWTGAAFFLRVDTRLRTESGGRHSLDDALARFHECCMDRYRRWNARRLVETLGEVSIAEIWHQEYRRTIDELAEPRYRDALTRLGISRQGRSLRLDDSESPKALRQAIAGTRPPFNSGRFAGPDEALQEPASSAP